MESDDELVLEEDGGLAILRLNRPLRLNALSARILERMAAEVPRLVSDPSVRAILITGTGRAFCAGGDIGVMGGPSDPEAIVAGMRAPHVWLKALRSAEKPVITAVNGAAAGAGFGLALVGDLVVASETAFFKAAFSQLGAAADYGLAFTLPRAVGGVRAAEILFGDRRVSAQEALEIGLINQVLSAETFEAESLEFARGVARSSRGAQLTKRLLRCGEADAFAKYLEAEAQAQAEAFASEDFREGVAAFRESRTAVFRGR
jgi:2-(1,2-epoxy-1,2-dihydrophenyl)acetyl-CoA isomerase